MMYSDSLLNRIRIFSLLFLLPLFGFGCAASKKVASESAEPAGVSAPVISQKAVDHAILGALSEVHGDFIRAIHHYNQALLYDSTSAALYQSIAENYQLIGELESARLILEKGIKHVGMDRDLLLLLGKLLFRLERYQEAVNVFVSIVELYPEDHEAWYKLGTLHIRCGEHLAAVDCYDRVMEIRGPDMDILIRQATILSLANENERAIEAYTWMHRLHPEDDLIPFTIGGLYLEMGDSVSADSVFEIATNINPVNPRYWDLRIRLAVILDDTLKSFCLIDSALKHNQDNTDLIVLASSVYNQFKRLDEAEDMLLKAVELDTSGVSYLINLGFLYHEQERWEDAEKVYLRGLAIDENDPLLNNNYAYMLAETGQRYEDALVHVERALEAEPENPSFLDTKGWLLYLLGDCEEAIKFLEAAALSTPDNPEILDHLGEVYFTLGEKERAKIMWTKAIEQGGDEEKIRPKLAR